MFFYIYNVEDVEFVNSSTIVFEPSSPAGGSLEKCVELLATDDNLLEISESVSVEVNVSSLVTNDMVEPSSVEVTVMDADGECCHYVFGMM